MRSRVFKIFLAGLLLLSFFSCSGEKEENLSIFKPFFRIQKNASMEEEGSFVKNGMLLFGALLVNDKGEINHSIKVLDSFTVSSPDGSDFQKLITDAPFEIRARTGGSGYQLYGLKYNFIMWFGINLLYDVKTPPPSGNYNFHMTLKSGKKLSVSVPFEGFKEDPIKGYPEKIVFDEKSRKVKWNPSKGQSGYKVFIFQGVKQGNPDMSKLVYSSEMSKLEILQPEFSLPETFNFESSQNYYFIVESYFSKTGDSTEASYVHRQESDSQIAVYQASNQPDQKTSQKTPLALKEVPYPYPVKYMQINGNPIAYIDEGKGQPIVLIHGLSTDLNSFSMLYPFFLEKGFRVIALDLVGYGKSAKPDLKHTIDFHSKTVVELIKNLKLSNPLLLGHSMGGAIGLYIALKYPKIIRSLILITPGGSYPFADGVDLYFKSVYDSQFAKRYSDVDAAKAYYKESVKEWNEAMENFMIIRERSMNHPDWKALQKTIKNSSISFMETNNEIARKVHLIQIPVLAVFGENDNIIKATLALGNVKEKNLNWQVEVLKNCGHMMQYEKKDQLLELIKNFLDQKIR